jgi:hypothetical protein
MWTVHLAAADSAADARSATVTLTVCTRDGEPSPDQADRLRRYLEEHRCLSRNPSPAELETLDAAGRNGGEVAPRPRRAWRQCPFRA